MKASIRQVLATAAGVLLAAGYVTIVKAIDLEMDWATLGVGAVALFGIVYVLGADEGPHEG